VAALIFLCVFAPLREHFLWQITAVGNLRLEFPINFGSELIKNGIFRIVNSLNE